MGFIELQAEQTTAATDLILFILCIALAVVISRRGRSKDEGRSRYWTILFLLLGFSAGSGAVAHGIDMPTWLNDLVWLPLNLGLGLTISFFILIVILELRGAEKARKFLPFLIGIGIGFFIFTALVPGVFLLFIIYEGLAMLFALGAFFHLARKREGKHYWVISAGVFLTMIAAVIQAIEPLSLTLIWEFDHNGLFHIVQMFALIVLTCGIIYQIGDLDRSL
ncbi:MAG: hypothetical protein U9R75_12505 [Candidatus Thermoplasmatota archaeon]|nr:hypothetical protein [Candidatus Thermoplasmatota archaeon]